MPSLLFWLILWIPLASKAESDPVFIKCTECVNYNCGATANSQGFCFRIYLANMCASECSGTDWTGAGAKCRGELVPKPYFVGKAPVQPCTYTSTGTRTRTLTSTSSGTGTATQSQTASTTATQTAIETQPDEMDSPTTSPSTLKAAKIETETARKDAANFKQTVSVLKIENEKSAKFFEEKKRDLDLGRPLTDVLKEASGESGGLMRKSGLAQDSISKNQSSSWKEMGEADSLEEKQKKSQASKEPKNSESAEYSSKSRSGIGNQSNSESGEPGKGKPAIIDRLSALELLRARLKKLIEEKTAGAQSEAQEIQNLIQMIEGGKIQQVEEEKLLAYLNSKPEFHLDEAETRAAIRDLIGEFEDAQIPDTDLFERVRDAHKRSLQLGRIRGKKKN